MNITAELNARPTILDNVDVSNTKLDAAMTALRDEGFWLGIVAGAAAQTKFDVDTLQDCCCLECDYLELGFVAMQRGGRTCRPGDLHPL
jgi:hypothetical protein